MVEVAASLTKSDGLLLGEIGSVLIGLGIATLIAHKIRFSVVPVFLCAGLFFGKGGIVALSLSDDFLSLGAQIGAILLLLLLGLEYSARELTKSFNERKSLGLIDILINFIPGLVAALIFGWGWLGALVLGGITYVSSSGIASQFIKDERLQSFESTKRAVSVLVIEDLFLAVYLPILSGVIASVAVLTGLISVSIAMVVTALALLIGARGVSVKHTPTFLGDSATLLLTVFGAAMLASGLATYVGFSGAVAAFLVGLLLTGDVAIVARIRLAPLRDLFSAIFFLFFGLQTDPATIPAVLVPALLLAIFGVATKYITAWWATRDLTEPNALKSAASLLIPRGEFSILIAGLAANTTFGPKLQALTINEFASRYFPRSACSSSCCSFCGRTSSAGNDFHDDFSFYSALSQELCLRICHWSLSRNRCRSCCRTIGGGAFSARWSTARTCKLRRQVAASCSSFLSTCFTLV
ncbi:MAG: cation:proton antiporter [Actinobacteria bacterium]|nr:cation:proton antiporter [Actinomycetota bacterium]